MLSDLLPLPSRAALAAVCLGLAWWAFGRAGAATRRPWAVWAAGFCAVWLVGAGEGFAWLFGRGGKYWLPVVAVGVAGSWFVLRGTRGTAAGRRWAAPAVGLMIAAPFLAKAGEVAQARYDLTNQLTRLTGLSRWEMAGTVKDGLGGVAVLLAAGCLAAAAWRPPPSREPGEEPG